MEVAMPGYRLPLAIVGALVAFTASAAMAQSLPQYRDSRTGTLWTPVLNEQIEQQEAYIPDPSVDRAFDPRSQNVRIQGTVVQHPRGNLMGTVPITAGPAVPLMTLDLPSLQVIPQRHWLTILYVTNNSAGTIDAVVGCHFTNQGRTVETTRVIVPPAGPGERLGLPVRGPRYDIFVDQVSCQLLSPA
jgi:hypothetical protein